MLRFLPCYQALESIRLGMNPTEAAKDALGRIAAKFPNFKGGIVVVDRVKQLFGAAGHGWDFPFSVWYKGMDKVEVIEAPVVKENKF